MTWAQREAYLDLFYRVSAAAGEIHQTAGSNRMLGKVHCQRSLGESLLLLRDLDPMLRHMLAAILLGSRIPVTGQEMSGVFEYLVPEASSETYSAVVNFHRNPARREEPSIPLEEERAGLTRYVLGRFYPLSGTSSFDQYTVSAWAAHRSKKELGEIAPRLDPQVWDESGFIDEAFGLASFGPCADHKDPPAKWPGYYDRRPLHERVTTPFAALACDLAVWFQAFPSTSQADCVKARYRLHCSHGDILERNEGIAYVREESGKRLIFVTKHVRFTKKAPPELIYLIRALLRGWLAAMLYATFPR